MQASMLKRLVGSVLDLAFDAPVRAASSQELEYQAELRAKFQQLPVLDTSSAPPSEAQWLRNVDRLRKHVLNDDARQFLRWDVIAETMSVSYARYAYKELKYLRGLPTWDRWREAIGEIGTGHPVRYPLYPASSGITIHHAYHLAQFEAKTGAKISDMNCVFEFGGGYGNLCRLVHRLGFKGRYVLFDLPAFSALQCYYFKTVRVLDVSCQSDFHQLEMALREFSGNRLFIATWSLSETPLTTRIPVLKLLREFEHFLIAYQDRFGEVDNLDFFNRWKDSTKAAWHSWPIAHLPGNHYMIGTPLSRLSEARSSR